MDWSRSAYNCYQEPTAFNPSWYYCSWKAVVLLARWTGLAQPTTAIRNQQHLTLLGIILVGVMWCCWPDGLVSLCLQRLSGTTAFNPSWYYCSWKAVVLLARWTGLAQPTTAIKNKQHLTLLGIILVGVLWCCWTHGLVSLSLQLLSGTNSIEPFLVLF